MRIDYRVTITRSVATLKELNDSDLQWVLVGTVRRERIEGQRGLKVIPRRWVVERTLGRLMHHRRLARDYETHPHRSEAMICLAMIDLISRRLTRESTLNWRNT